MKSTCIFHQWNRTFLLPPSHWSWLDKMLILVDEGPWEMTWGQPEAGKWSGNWQYFLDPTLGFQDRIDLHNCMRTVRSIDVCRMISISNFKQIQMTQHLLYFCKCKLYFDAVIRKRKPVIKKPEFSSIFELNIFSWLSYYFPYNGNPFFQRFFSCLCNNYVNFLNVTRCHLL